jgi:uncharacterized membrane protein (UPF0136 family)
MIAGTAILTLFGGWWCIAALVNWTGHPGWSIPTAFVTTIVLLVLCVMRLVASRKIPAIDDPVAAAKGKGALGMKKSNRTVVALGRRVPEA